MYSRCCALAAWRRNDGDDRGSSRDSSSAFSVSLKPFCRVLPVWLAFVPPSSGRRSSGPMAATALSVAVGMWLQPESIAFRRWIEIGRQVAWFAHPMNASLAGLLARRA